MRAVVGIRVLDEAACDGMERVSGFKGTVAECGSVPPARALSLEVRPRRR